MPGFAYGGEHGATYGGDNGSVYSTPLPRQVKNLVVAATRASEADLTWSAAEGATEYVVYQAESSGTTIEDYTEVATTTNTNATVTGLENGEQYYFRVAGRNNVGEGPLSTEVDATADLPPTEITAMGGTTVRELTLTLDPQDNSTDGGIDIYRSTDGTLGTTVATGLAPGTTSYTDTGLDDGREYFYTVRRVTDHAQTDGTRVAATTTLPDEDAPVLGNGVEDEVAVDRESAPTNYGSVRIQIRETGQSSWDASATGFGEFVGAFDTLSMEFVGRLDGEEYEVRARTETPNTTGAWTEPVAITTKFPGVTDVTVTAISETEVELAWTDNADNEDGQYIVRERRGPDGSWWFEQIVGDAGPNTEAYTDDTPAPDTEFRYRVRPYTEHTTADSNLVTATTGDIGVSRRRIPPSGWYVELETNAGDVLRPTVLEGPTPRASLNDVPRVEIPVPDSDRWRDDALQRCEMRVWRDGERLPIERFERLVQQSDPPRVVLHGRGGIGLDADIEVDQGSVRDAHDLASELINQETPYEGTVDDPASDLRDDIGVLTGDLATGLVNAFVNFDNLERNNDIPAYVNVDGLATPAQVCWMGSARFPADRSTTPGTILDDGGETYMNDRAYRLEQVGDYIEWEFDAEYAVPAADFFARIRYRIPNESAHPRLTAYLNGQQIDFRVADVENFGGNAEPAWFEFNTVDNFTSGTLNGSQTFRIEVTESSSDPDGHWLVDGFAAADGTFESELDFDLGVGPDAIDTNGIIAGPQLYPDAVDLLTEERSTIEQVVAGRLSVNVDNTTGSQAVAISNDGGETWIEAANATEVTGEFADGSARIQGRVTLGRYDADPTSHPRTGDATQQLDSLELAATLADTPFVRGYADSGSVLEVLQNLADAHRFIFELGWDSDANGGDGGIVIEWTQPGQRQASTTAPVLDYETETDAETIVEAAWVYGRSRRVRDQEVTLSTTGYESIGDGYIQPGTERVFDPDTEEVFQIGDDYEMRYNEGAIIAVGGGAISNGQTVAMDYGTRLAAFYAAPDADGTGDTIRETVAGANTQQLANQAAMAIVKELSEPLIGASVTLDRTADVGLVGALDIEGVPAEAEVVRGLEEQGSELDVRIGNRRSGGQVIEDIRRRVSAVAKRL